MTNDDRDIAIRALERIHRGDEPAHKIASDALWDMCSLRCEERDSGEDQPELVDRIMSAVQRSWKSENRASWFDAAEARAAVAALLAEQRSEAPRPGQIGVCGGCGGPSVCDPCYEKRGTADDPVRRSADAPPTWALVAWLWDRREQYKPSSGTYAAFDELLVAAADGAHVDAWKHGELDDLRGRAETILARRPRRERAFPTNPDWKPPPGAVAVEAFTGSPFVKCIRRPSCTRSDGHLGGCDPLAEPNASQADLVEVDRRRFEAFEAWEKSRAGRVEVAIWAASALPIVEAARAWRLTRGTTEKEWEVDKEGWRLAVAVDALDNATFDAADASSNDAERRADAALRPSEAGSTLSQTGGQIRNEVDTNAGLLQLERAEPSSCLVCGDTSSPFAGGRRICKDALACNERERRINGRDGWRHAETPFTRPDAPKGGT